MFVEFTTQFLEAMCLYREARGEPADAKLAIHHVLRNRAAFRTMWPGSVAGVILQPHQFDGMTQPGDPELTVWPQPYKEDIDWAAWIDCCAVVENPGPDPTGGAVYYEAVDPSKLDELRSHCPWFAADKLSAQLGKTRFYKA